MFQQNSLRIAGMTPLQSELVPRAMLPSNGFRKSVVLSATVRESHLPLTRSGGASRLQFLVRAADLGGAGPMLGLSLRSAAPIDHCVCRQLVIRLAHTDKSELGGDLAANLATGNLHTVLSADHKVLPAAPRGEYFSLVFDRPFNYNGADNLVVEISCAAASVPVTVMASPGEPSYHAAVVALGPAGVGAFPPTTHLPHLEFRFAGGVSTLCRSQNSVNEFIPFNNFSNLHKMQTIYYSDEINGAGRITGIGMRIGQACRLAQTHTINLRLGHTSRDELSGDFGENFDLAPPAVLADQARVQVPADVVAGEYIWLPLHDGSFVYNGVDNLLLEVEVTASSGTTRWAAHVNGGRRRRAFGLLGAATTECIDSGAYDVRLAFAARAITL